MMIVEPSTVGQVSEGDSWRRNRNSIAPRAVHVP